MHRKRVEQFIRENTAGDFIRQVFTDFEDAVVQLGRSAEDVLPDLPVKAADFDDFGHLPLPELTGEDATEQRADADASEVVTGFADVCRAGGVVTVLWVIKRQFHE